MTSITRRTFLSGAAGLLAVAASGPSLAQFAGTPAPTRFSAIAVDVGPLLGAGLGPYAEYIRRALTVETERAFADLRGPGPKLVVRITGVSMNAYVGSSGGSRGGRGSTGGDNDYLEGEALFVGPRGEILSRHRQLSALPASSGGAWYDPASEQRRVVALAEHYAQWLRRDLGP